MGHLKELSDILVRLPATPWSHPTPDSISPQYLLSTSQYFERTSPDWLTRSVALDLHESEFPFITPQKKFGFYIGPRVFIKGSAARVHWVHRLFTPALSARKDGCPPLQFVRPSQAACQRGYQSTSAYQSHHHSSIESTASMASFAVKVAR